MKTISFPYEEKSSLIFGTIKRPIAIVSVWSSKRKRWLGYTAIVDTGADYTVFPFKVSGDLGINVEKECNQFFTRGIGGSEKVYLLKKKILIKIGDWKIKIPIGFLERDDIPPLLGREKCLNNLNVLFSKFTTYFFNFNLKLIKNEKI